MVVGMDWFIENTLLRAKKQPENYFVIKIMIRANWFLILANCLKQTILWCFKHEKVDLWSFGQPTVQTSFNEKNLIRSEIIVAPVSNNCRVYDFQM